MGVHNLWQILAPVKSEASIESLKGKKIAVDLAIWLVESQVTGMKMMQGRVVKPHLRNLFFRVSNFLRLGVKLVFVIDGTPPELKWEEMARRNEARLGGGGGGGRGRWRGRGRGGGGGVKKASRSHFACWLKECQELLELMGVPCIQSKGEAEAMCAALNSSGIVDGCMTEDGDAFLYGARVVYRNLNMATGKVDCYSMADIETDLDLDRRRLVALAILLGCDYLPKGVPGIGKEVAMRFMNSLPSSVDPLKLFQDWSRGCDSTCSANVERDVRKKSLRVEGFPNQDVIKEFLDNKERPPAHHTEWRRPLLQHLQQFNLVKMDWPHEYTQEKVVPLVTLYDLTHMTSDPRGCLHPAGIVKLRVRQGVQCVEVKWHKPDEDKENDEDADPYYTTVEERALFTYAYPDMMEQFLVAMETKKNRGRGKKKKEPSWSLQQGRATDEGQSSADVGVMLLLENEQPCDVSLPLSQAESYDRDRSKLRSRELGSGYETATDVGKSNFAVENHHHGDTDDEDMVMKLINLSLHDSKTQESMEGRGEPQQGNRAEIAGGGRRQKRTQDRKKRIKPGRNCLKGKETRSGKESPAEIASEELSTLKTRSLPVVPAVIMKSRDRKQAMKEIHQVSNDKNTGEEEDEEKEEVGEEESFIEVLPLSQRLGCHSLRGFVPSSRIKRNHCSSGASSDGAKSTDVLSSDSESDSGIPETSPLSCDEEILETNPAEIKPLEFSLGDSNKEIKRARDSSEARTRSEQFPDEESPDTVPVETTFVDLTFANVDEEVEVTNHAPGTHAESKWPHLDSPCEHSGRRSQKGHMDQKLLMAKEMAETTPKLEIVLTLDMQLNSPLAGNQDTKISVVHPSCHKLTTATHEVIDLTEDNPLDDKCITTVHSAEEAAIHQSPSAVTSDVASRSLDEKKNDDDEGRSDRGRLDKISRDQENSKFSTRKNVSSFMKLDSSLAKFMDELSLVSYSASAAASFTESDDSVFIVEDEEPCSDERTHVDEKNEEKEEKCVSSCEGTVKGQSMGIQELFLASEALDKIDMVPEEKVNDTAVKSEPTVQGDLQDGTEHHGKEPVNVHMISDHKTNSKLDCLFVTKQAIDVKLEDGELCRKETNNIDKETLDCIMTATFNSVEASERPSCKPQLHKEVPLSNILHKQMENLSPPVLLGKKKVKPRRGHVSKAKKRHKMMKSSSLHDSVLLENDLMNILQTMSPLSVLPDSVSQQATCPLSEATPRSEDPPSRLLLSASQEGRPCPELMYLSPSVSSPSVTTSSCSSSTSGSTLLVAPNLPNPKSLQKSDQTTSPVPTVPCATLADSVAGLHVSPCISTSYLHRAQLLSMLSQLTPGDSPLMDLKALKNPQRSVQNCVGHQNLNSEGNQSTHLDSVDTDSVTCRDILKQSIQQNHVREPIRSEIDCGCKCITSKSKVHVQGQNCLPNVCVGQSEVRIQETLLQGTRNVPKSKSLDKPRLKPKPRSLSQTTRTVKRNKGSRHMSCSQPARSNTTSRSRSRSKSSVKHFQRRESVLEMECGLAQILEGLVTE